MTENINTVVIEQLTAALSQTRTQLLDVEAEYNRLRAQTTAYEQSIANLKALESGNFAEVGLPPAPSAPPKIRRDSHTLKEHIHEYFKSRPRIVQSPKGLSRWLVDTKNWDDEGLRPRLSNLLRKVVKEESWLNRAGHGKYQYVKPS